MNKLSRGQVAAICDANTKDDQRPTEVQLPQILITPPPLRSDPAARYHLLQDRQGAPIPLDPVPPDPLAGASSSISSSVSNSVSSSLSSSAIDQLQAASSRFTATLSTFSLTSSAAVKSARDNGFQDGSASVVASARTSASSVIASATAQAVAALSQAASISSSVSLILAGMTGGASAISSIQSSASSAVDAAQSSASNSARSAIDAAVASASAAVRNNVDVAPEQASGTPPGQLAGIVVGTAIASSVVSIVFTLLLVRYRRRKAAETTEGISIFDPNSRQPGQPVLSAGQDNVFTFPNNTSGARFHRHAPSNSFPPDAKQGYPSPAKVRPMRFSISAGRPLPSVPSVAPTEPATPLPYSLEPNSSRRDGREPGFGLGLYSSDTEQDPQTPVTISTMGTRRDTRGDLAPMMKFSITRKRSTSGGQRMQLVRVGNKKDSIHRLLSQEATPPNTGRRVDRYSNTEGEELYGTAEIDRETPTSTVQARAGSTETPEYQLPSLSDVSSISLNPMKFGRSAEPSSGSSSTSSSTTTPRPTAGKDNAHMPKREYSHLRPRSSPAAPGRRTTATVETMQSDPPPPLPPPPPPPPQEQPQSRFSPYSTPTRSSMSVMSLAASSPPLPLPLAPPPPRMPSLQAPIPRRPNIAASVISLDQQLQQARPPPRPQGQGQTQTRPRTAPKPGTAFSLFPRD